MSLEFKALKSKDIENVRKIYSNSEVRKYLGGVILEADFDTKFKTLLEEKSHWCVFEGKQFIGLVSLDLHHNKIDYEVSYQLLSEFWYKGYGTKSLKFLLHQAIKQGLKSVIAETQSKNIASTKLLERAGFILLEELERFGEKQSLYSKKIEDSEINSE